MAWDPGGAWQEVAQELGLSGAVTRDLAGGDLSTAAWPAWVPQPVLAQLRRNGIDQPYEHQAAAAAAAWSGRDVALATGTATGKSLGYLLPILGAIGDDEALPATSLYVAPTKALARDQLRLIEEFRLPGLRAAAYDGDTPSEQRRWVRRHASVVVTNPDMLHSGILPGSEAWQSFLKRLRFVVIDEFHVYRGLFGANLAALVRRLLRLAEHYGGSPVVIGTSATVADAGATLSALTGRPATTVSGGNLSRSDLHLVLVPPDGTGLVERAAAVTAALVAREIRTLSFVRSRRSAEAVTALARQRLRPAGLAERFSSYRGGYLPEERRDLEARLRDGRLTGMAATSALELGIDVSGLDAVIVAGWPGTRAALRQRLGRAGRTRRPALGVFLADDDPLDAYIVRNPDHLTSGLEGMVIDAANPYVLAPHLCAAAAELPLRPGEAEQVFGPGAGDLLRILRERGLLRKRLSGWYWTRPERATSHVNIRGTPGESISVVEVGTGRLIGSVDRASADRTVFAGAVYTHLGADYLIERLDQDASVADAQPARVPYSTHPVSTHHTRLLQVLDSHEWGEVGVRFGVVEVDSQVTSYLKRRLTTGEVIGGEPLALPRRTLRTKACWLTIPDPVLRLAGIAPSDTAGASHAAEHAAIGMLPLFAHCDRWDIGGLSTASHPDTGVCTIVIHDGVPGGAGFSERGLQSAPAWWRATLAAIEQCPCADGCPACVVSPKCGSGNEPLDKAAAVRLIAAILRHAPGSPGGPSGAGPREPAPLAAPAV